MVVWLNGLLAYRLVRLLAYRRIGLSAYWLVGLLAYWIISLLAWWLLGWVPYVRVLRFATTSKAPLPIQNPT